MTETGEQPPLKGAVPLSKAINALRDELWQACWDGQQHRLKFRPGPAELTLQVAVTVDAKAKFGVKAWVIEAGGELSRQSAATQTIKLSLTPVMFDQQGHVMDEIFIDTADEPRNGGGDELLDAAE